MRTFLHFITENKITGELRTGERDLSIPGQAVIKFPDDVVVHVIALNEDPGRIIRTIRYKKNEPGKNMTPWKNEPRKGGEKND